MGPLKAALLLLAHFWALQGTLRLSVKQSPALLRVEQGSQANLTCQVAHDQGWEQLRFLWTKDGEELCQPRVISDCLSPEVCGPQGQLSWRAPETLILRLDPVRAEYSGNYVCWAAVEIPELVQGEGNGTELLVEAALPPGTSASSIPGFLLGLLVAGGMAITAVALCLGIWGHRRCGQRDSGPGNAFYSNVLYRPRGTPKKTEASPGEGKVPDPPRANQKGESFYLMSFPPPPAPKPPHLPPTQQPHQLPKPCPSPKSSHSIATIKGSPSLSALEPAWPRGSPRVRRGVSPQGPRKGPTSDSGYAEM